MFFSRQRRVLFRHQIAIESSKSGPNQVIRAFWLENVLRATTACAFSTSQLPKALRTPCGLTLFTSKCASRQNGVRFFNISTSKNAPSMRHFWLQNVLRATAACNFSSLIWPAGSALAALACLNFAPPEPQIIGTTTCFPPQSRAPFHLSSGQMSLRPPL